MSGVIHSHHAVVSGDVVKRCPLFVSKHHLRHPEFMPLIVSQLEHATIMVSGRVEGQPRVEPPLAHVHTERIVLQCTNTQRTHLLLISLWTITGTSFHQPHSLHIQR